MEEEYKFQNGKNAGTNSIAGWKVRDWLVNKTEKKAREKRTLSP